MAADTAGAPTSFDRGGWGWLFQRITAAFLIVVLAFHFFLLHFYNHAYEVTFAGTSARMGDLAYFATMWLFLVAATFHGVNGIYNAMLNQGIEGTQKRVAQGVLGIAALLLVVQGTRVALVMNGFL
ncbi:succinate dehydrogenase hydrophobic membrane anchor subunit [Halorubellus sp. JP-L1]|uniref:succinate dehydrogenase hydrophobic membrane anchor subunit n=1 Tax=Halorubellus sp. JP-L1 TaxID=2715753 RepID=UPI00140E62C0|nr:succinate dehydrogenase hydrophobic membrane anchor subunit [Halorubellus sp. JP-L1]NHN40177.1 succinate dehydrogenase hydrophobic membrane anchor subunit [Halorubellus sp. JP-L1]